jgi:hypothetical protein
MWHAFADIRGLRPPSVRPNHLAAPSGAPPEGAGPSGGPWGAARTAGWERGRGRSLSATLPPPKSGVPLRWTRPNRRVLARLPRPRIDRGAPPEGADSSGGPWGAARTAGWEGARPQSVHDGSATPYSV